MKDKDQSTLTLVVVVYKSIRLVQLTSAYSINVTVSDDGKVER